MENEINVAEIGVTLVQLGLQLIELKEYLAKRRKRFRRWWSKPLIIANYLTGYNAYTIVFKYFKINDEEQFVAFTRMDVQTFMYKYNLVQERLIKRSRRPPLPAELRLCVTLNYLAHGDSSRKNVWFFNIGLSTVKIIIAEVCNVLCVVLTPLLIAFPLPQQFQVIANEFMADLHFPNCLGAIDGKHCMIQKPPNSGSLFYNYKHYYSIVLMACCDSKKRFIWMNVGSYGSLNDAGIFANSDMGRALSEDRIELPPAAPLPNTATQSPYFFIGDGGFPLKPYLMKPFIRNEQLSMPHRAFNYRLSHARRIIESAFGQLAQTWLVYKEPLRWKFGCIEQIITSTICLHNLLIDFQHNEVGNRWNFDNLRFMQNLQDRDVVGGPLQEHRIREGLCEYFTSPAGSVPWQWARM